MIPRSKVHKIEAALAVFPAVAIVGARQVGKTTLIRNFLSQSTEEDLKPKHMYIVTPADGDYWLEENIQVVGVKQLSVITNTLLKQAAA